MQRDVAVIIPLTQPLAGAVRSTVRPAGRSRLRLQRYAAATAQPQGMLRSTRFVGESGPGIPRDSHRRRSLVATTRSRRHFGQMLRASFHVLRKLFKNVF